MKPGMAPKVKSLANSLVLLLVLVLVSWPDQGFSQTVGTREEISRILVLENVTVKNGMVAGVVRNISSHTVRDVDLFIRYTWLWDDEYHPGKPDPGTSAIHTLKQEIPPGETARFTFTPSPPLPKIMGGRFDISASVAGFTEIIPQKR
jgi:hypothetical protein